MTKADDHYVQVAETLIEKLEQGTAPWQKPVSYTHLTLPTKA